jgi:pSer/pThr/pTyr-binding forkhead associated (FHA) protein
MSGVYCNQCGHHNPAGSRYCSSCGASLGVGVEDHTETIMLDESVSIENLIHAGDDPVLAVMSGHRAGSSYVLGNQVVQIGRHPDSDIFLDDITVSRRHASLHRVGIDYQLRDAGSLNGTYLNHERCEEATLRQGDELQVGKFKLMYFTPTGESESVD